MEKQRSRSIGKTFSRYPQLATLIGFIAIFIIFSVATDTFLTPNNLINIVNQTAVIAVTGFGMTLVLLTGGIDLSIGGIAALVCVICAMGFESGFSVPLMIIIGLLLGALCGFANGMIISRFRIQPFLVTMGMVNITRGLARYISGGTSIFISQTKFRTVISQGKVGGIIPVLAFWIVAVLIIIYIIISKTSFGRKVQATGGNEEAAGFSGVKTKRVKVIVYTISGLCAAFAGVILMSRLSSGLPTVADGAEMDAIAAAVLGGTGFAGEGGNVFGTLLGAFVIGTIVNGLTVMGVDSYLQDVVKGIIIILTVIVSVQLSRLSDK